MGRARSQKATGPTSRSGAARPIGPSPGYREELRIVLAEMLEGRPEIEPGLMFGFPAFYAAGKLVACVYGTGLGLRLPPEEATALRGRSSHAFEPYGRMMRAWTFLEPLDPEELRAETAVLEAAIDRAEQDGGARRGGAGARRRLTRSSSPRREAK